MIVHEYLLMYYSEYPILFLWLYINHINIGAPIDDVTTPTGNCAGAITDLDIKSAITKIIEPNNNNPEKEFLAASLEEQINHIVNNYLPDKCKEIFILSRIEKLSNPDIALKLGINIRTVENQIYRAIKTLKKNLKNYLWVQIDCITLYYCFYE